MDRSFALGIVLLVIVMPCMLSCSKEPIFFVAEENVFDALEMQAFVILARTIEELTPQELAGRILRPSENWAILADMAGQDIEILLIDEVFLSSFIDEPKVEVQEVVDPSLVVRYQAIVRQTFLPSRATMFQQTTMIYFEYLPDSTGTVRKGRLEMRYTVDDEGRISIRRFLWSGDGNPGESSVELSNVDINSKSRPNAHED